MIIINRSRKALTISAALMLMAACAQSSSAVASTSTSTSINSSMAAPEAANPDAAKPLYETTKIEVSDADIGYVKIDQFPSENSQINPVRWQALYETALSLGATGALAWRSEQVNQSLDQNAAQLNKIFDFNQLLLNDNVLPPVLVESDNSLNLASDDSIRLSAKTYKIISPARFVTAAPSWRTYLWMSYPKPSVPDRTLLPKNKAEAELWNHFIREGWINGVAQANAIFAANLNRLRRDYNGMILYRKMLAQGMVSAPYIAKADMGVTGNRNEMRVDDRILRITANSELNTDSSTWQPILTNPQQDLKP